MLLNILEIIFINEDLNYLNRYYYIPEKYKKYIIVVVDDNVTLEANSLENLYETFKGCSTLQIIDLSKFETSKVTTMEGMFQNCSSFRFLDLSNLLPLLL